jgi:hypothetical protein
VADHRQRLHYLKSVIPLVHPFYLDPVLAEWDRTLHFGIDPWRYLQPILGYAPITYLIGFGTPCGS